MSDETQTAITGPKEGDPISGQLWRHHSGRVYRVERVTNTAHISEKFPPMVVYVNVYNGTEWSRPLSDWHRSFTFVGFAPIRAVGTEGGATDGTGTRTVEWPGESEITRLRDEVERLTKERDEARRTVENQSFLIVENIQDHADRDARIREEGRREGIEEAARVATSPKHVAPVCPYANDQPGDPTWTHTDKDVCPVCKKTGENSAGHCTVFVGGRISTAIRALLDTPTKGGADE